MVRSFPRHRHLLAAAALVALGGSGAALAQASVKLADADNARGLWFVEMTGAPTADGNTVAAVRAEKANFRAAAAAAGVQYRERAAFDRLFNGFSVRASLAERNRLAQLPGVKAVYPVDLIQAPKPERSTGGAAPDLADAIKMTGADIAQNSLGLTGAGIKVGIIDSGIDIDHRDLGGNGTPGSTPFPTARVAYGHDFVGDEYDANLGNTPMPDGNPDDCGGHGTHVAGIVGADGVVKGVAPKVTLGAYRVFGCNGSTDSDIVIAAMERALGDGMQVINMSLGSRLGWPVGPYADAVTRLRRSGVVVVASAGNNGPSGSPADALYATGSPGNSADAISVASFDNLASTQPAFTVSPDNRAIGFSPATGAPLPPSSGSLPMSRTGTTTTVDDACNPLPAGSLSGTAVLIRRGTCAFYVKAFNAQSAGAAAVVLYNNAPGVINPTVVGDPPITIPVVSITAADGALLNSRIAAGATTLTWGTGTVRSPLATAGLISGFSSFGLTADLNLKPNIGAPGGSIYSTYPLEEGGHASLSGTSMASPHVAGLVALMLQADPKLKAKDVGTVLQNSAVPKLLNLAPQTGLLDNVHRQGAGMADVVASVQATARVTPSQLALGDSAAGPIKRTLTIENRGSTTVTYDLSTVSATATGPNAAGATAYVVGGYYNTPATVAFSAPSVTVRPGSSAAVDVTVTAPANLVDKGIYGGYVVLTPQGGQGSKLRVPYAGFKGDYQSIQVLTPTANGFPWLAKVNGPNLTKQPADGAVYSLAGDDIPYVLMHLDHQSRRIDLKAIDAKGRSFNISRDEYVPRNGAPSGYFAWVWDGSTYVGKGKNAQQWSNVPNGVYTIQVSVLKALGNPDNPADWEIWNSPSFSIAR